MYFYTVCNGGGEEQIKDLKQINPVPPSTCTSKFV